MRKEAMQRCYDLAKSGLLAQGKKSTRQVTDIFGWRMHVCAYRGPGGRKCAVGFLISDEDYDPAFESGSIRRVLERILHRPLDLRDYDALEFLERLQYIHDGHPPSRWPAKLAAFAEAYGLTP